jgi:signal transduction histidine kinase
LYTQIVFSDNGEGFDKEDIPNLFRRFYKGKNSSAGSIGIGLALARMIIVSQNGTIIAENNRDGGARFTVRFYKTVV